MRDRDDRDDRNDDEYERRPRARAQSGGGGGGKVVLIILGVVVLLALVCGGGFVGVMFWGVSSVRKSAMQMTDQNNMKELVLAVHNYEFEHSKLPPAALKTKEGKPGLSWRVAILPHLDQGNLYKQFKLDEPWDSANNLPLLNAMPKQFARPGGAPGNTTHYRIFVGNGAVFDYSKPARISRITDGTSNTIAIVEAANAVPWTKPEELDYDPKGTLPVLGFPDQDFVNVAMFDGSVVRVKKSTNPANWHKAINGSDNQVPDPDFFMR